MNLLHRITVVFTLMLIVFQSIADDYANHQTPRPSAREKQKGTVLFPPIFSSLAASSSSEKTGRNREENEKDNDNEHGHRRSTKSRNARANRRSKNTSSDNTQQKSQEHPPLHAVELQFPASEKDGLCHWWVIPKELRHVWFD